MPATDSKKIEKALYLECDGIILDLEDAVGINEKSFARKNIVGFLSKERTGNKKIYVRINGLATLLWKEDIEVIVPLRPDVIVVPKVESNEEVNSLDVALEALEKKLGLQTGIIRLQILLESAKGILNMQSILSSSKRIISATIGMADLCKDLNISWESVFGSVNHFNLFIAERTKLSLVSKSLDLEPPWDCVYMNFNDEENFVKDTLIGKNIGCQGKIAIHPKQIPIINNIYSITDEEIKQAKKIVDLYEESLRGGKGATKINGFLIDEPVVAQAKKILSLLKGDKVL
ncbi:MAG: CoA ester lyase [Thermoplasmata archaeon]